MIKFAFRSLRCVNGRYNDGEQMGLNSHSCSFFSMKCLKLVFLEIEKCISDGGFLRGSHLVFVMTLQYNYTTKYKNKIIVVKISRKGCKDDENMR